jgi:membrane associated rhomboid family serine protease
LYLLGRDLESIVGSKNFLYLYLVGAIAGEVGHLFLMPTDCALLAASGGVAAVMVAYATILPELELTGTVLLVLPVRIKAKHLAYGAFVLAILLVYFDRAATIMHSAYLGGGVAGWFYAHLLGFGRPSFLQRFLRQHKAEAERYEQMSLDQLMAQEIDPLLEKISRQGLTSLTRSERRVLFRARDKILQKSLTD